MPLLIAVSLTGLSLSCSQPKFAQRPETGAQPSSQSNSNQLSLNCHIELKALNGCLDLQWIEGPRLKQDDRLLVKFHRPNLFDQTRTVVDPSANLIEVSPSMPTMDHGTFPTQITKHDIGTFEVKPVYFSMVGPWRVEFVFAASNGSVVDRGAVDLYIED